MWTLSVSFVQNEAVRPQKVPSARQAMLCGQAAAGVPARSPADVPPAGPPAGRDDPAPRSPPPSHGGGRRHPLHKYDSGAPDGREHEHKWRQRKI